LAVAVWARLFRNDNYEGNPCELDVSINCNVSKFCEAAMDSRAFSKKLSAYDSSDLKVFAPGTTPEDILASIQSRKLPSNAKLTFDTTGDERTHSYYTILVPNTPCSYCTWFVYLCFIVCFA